jgi:hypothetical protein
MNGTQERGLIAAAAGFAVALVIFGAALVRALGVDPVPPPPAAEPDGTDAVTPERPSPLGAGAIQLAVENDPFRPDRQRPPERYRLPGDVDPEPPPPPPPPPPTPDFQLHGTIVGAGGSSSAALIQLGEEPPRLLPIGGTIGGYRVTQVAAQAAVVSDGSQDLLLRVPGPQQYVEAVPDPRRGNERDRNPSAREAQQAQRELQMRQRQLMQTLERARQSGASPQMLEALQRAIEQAGASGGTTVFIPNRIEMQERTVTRPDTRVIIRQPPDTTVLRSNREPDPRR